MPRKYKSDDLFQNIGILNFQYFLIFYMNPKILHIWDVSLNTVKTLWYLNQCIL